MTTQAPLPDAKDTIQWYHHSLATPLRLLNALNIGPLGGENSISAVIETIQAIKKGEEVTFSLSKSDQFFVTQFAGEKEPPDVMIEYRELNHEAQREILRRRGAHRLGVVWLGAGVFTLAHPLLAEQKQDDWHVWTDGSPKVVERALKLFNEMKKRDKLGKLSRNITLPGDVDQLNQVIQFIAPDITHLVIFGYGVTYALTMAENYRWLSRLNLPRDIDVSFVFNSPGEKIGVLPGVMASFHQQRMVYYERAHIEALFDAAVPGSEIVWEKPRQQTRNHIWGTWLIESTAASRQP